MVASGKRTVFELGQFSGPDRIQRLLVGGCLMMLTIVGLFDRVEWRGIIALLLQAELLLTALAGWCPVYWACRVTKRET
jgi:hypothetical protein